MARAKPAWTLQQGQFVSTAQLESEVLLELTVPLAADTELFRIGWSLKGLRTGGWICMTTGQAVWSRNDLAVAAEHIATLLDEIARLVGGGSPEDRR